MSAAPKHRFRIWAICLLIVFASAFTVFVSHVARSRSEPPYVSVSFVHTNISDKPALSIEVSNRMSFNLNCDIAIAYPESSVPLPLLHTNGAIAVHSQMNVGLSQPPKGTKVYVLYGRQLKPFEVSLLKKLPWLKSHYPFQHRYSTPIYEVKGTDK